MRSARSGVSAAAGWPPEVTNCRQVGVCCLTRIIFGMLPGLQSIDLSGC